MIKFSFLEKLPIRNFLSEKGITLLKFIEDNPQLYCSKLVIEVEKDGLMNRSSLFRYLKCFTEYSLIEKSERKKAENGYINYKLSKRGYETLKLFLKHFK